MFFEIVNSVQTSIMKTSLQSIFEYLDYGNYLIKSGLY